MGRPLAENRAPSLAAKGGGLARVHSRAATRHLARLERPPAVVALLTEASTASSCLDMAEELAKAVVRNMAAIHVGVDPETLIASAEEVDLQFYREVREGSVQERFERIRTEFARWRDADANRQRVIWKDRPGGIAECVRQECEDVDLIVMAHPGNLDGRDALHFALFHSTKLVGLAPRIMPTAGLLDHVVVGWKPHANAYATIEAAKLWLRAARRITVLCVNDREDQSYQKTASALFKSLSVKCDIPSISAGNLSVGECLLKHAADLDASCLMIGAYHHGPLLELVLGRVTRYVLAHASIPLLMKH